jgi:hypothetical protein
MPARSDNGDPINWIIYCLMCESRSSHGLGDKNVLRTIE